MSVAIYPAEVLDDALHARRRRERQLALAVGVSLVGHLVVVAVLPGLREDTVEPPRALEVTIVPPAPEPPPRVKPPPPPPIPRAPLPKPPPTPARVQPATAPPARQVLALPETAAPAAPSFTVPAPPEAPSTAPDAKIVAAPVAAPPGPPKELPVTPPVFNAAYLGNPPLRYPPMARKAGIEGTAMVRVLVSKDGRPLTVAVEKSSGSSVIDNAALELARAYKFVPARRGQEPIEQSITIPFVYKLEGSS